MHTIAFPPLIYLMVAITPATGQWEFVNPPFDKTVVYPDQKTCMAARQEMATPGIYLCLAYKDLPYMMEILTDVPISGGIRLSDWWDGHWFPLDGRGMRYGSGHGLGNVGYLSKNQCLTARQEALKDLSLAVQIGIRPPLYRCVPYNESYTDPDDPPSWSLQLRDVRLKPDDCISVFMVVCKQGMPYGGFYTQSECMEMGRYITDRIGERYTFECIHS
jgi:hypothetical protein